MSDSYTFRAVWSASVERWIGICVELPNLTWLADDHTTALRGIERLTGKLLADMCQAREPALTP